MAKKKTKNVAPKKNNLWAKYKFYIIPSVIGGFVAFFFSGSLELGIVVFIAVWIGNYVGRKFVNDK